MLGAGGALLLDTLAAGSVVELGGVPLLIPMTLALADGRATLDVASLGVPALGVPALGDDGAADVLPAALVALRVALGTAGAVVAGGGAAL